jgi:molecular chaperone DnaJ
MDPYQVLEVERNASQDDIKRSYKKLSKKYHPDINPEGTDQFKQIQEAYEILSNPEMKARFDQFGSTKQPRKQTSPFTSFFDDFFSGQQITQGQPLFVKYPVTLNQVLTGDTVKVSVRPKKRCSKCNGTGGDIVQCIACAAQGFRIMRGPHMNVRVTCEVCSGSGMKRTNSCGCDNGLVEGDVREESIQIPRGVVAGMRFTLPGGGHEPSDPDGVSGNLEIVITDAPNNKFTRLDAVNILSKVKVNYTELVFGGEKEIETLDGKVALKIPPATNPGTKLRIKGMGLYPYQGPNRGDQLVEIQLNIPTNLEGRHYELMKELTEIERSK